MQKKIQNQTLSLTPHMILEAELQLKSQLSAAASDSPTQTEFLLFEDISW